MLYRWSEASSVAITVSEALLKLPQRSNHCRTLTGVAMVSKLILSHFQGAGERSEGMWSLL